MSLTTLIKSKQNSLLIVMIMISGSSRKEGKKKVWVGEMESSVGSEIPPTVTVEDNDPK